MRWHEMTSSEIQFVYDKVIAELEITKRALRIACENIAGDLYYGQGGLTEEEFVMELYNQHIQEAKAVRND